MNRRLRLAGILVAVGVGLQLATLLSNHPLSFLAFMFVASPIVFAGMATYLFSLVTLSPKNRSIE